MIQGKTADLEALEAYKLELAALEAIEPKPRYPDPRAERLARLMTTISSLEWSIAHGYYGVEPLELKELK